MLIKNFHVYSNIQFKTEKGEKGSKT